MATQKNELLIDLKNCVRAPGSGIIFHFHLGFAATDMAREGEREIAAVFNAVYICLLRAKVFSSCEDIREYPLYFDEA